MLSHPDFVGLLAKADRHKEDGYHLISQYMDGAFIDKLPPVIADIFTMASEFSNDNDTVKSAVVNLAKVALCDYMERYETERLEKEG